MPTYEYECTKCGHRFEEFQKLSDPPVKSCPRCRKRRVRKLISRPSGFIFKGAGFYATEYRKPAPSEEADEGGEAKPSKEPAKKKAEGKKSKGKKDE